MKIPAMFVLLTLLTASAVWGKSSVNLADGLSQLLFGQPLNTVQSRYRVVDDKRAQAKPETPDTFDTLFYDRANGYMRIDYDPAPCGCGGSAIATVFKRQVGKPLFLKNEKTYCAYTVTDNGLSASEPLTQFLPDGFGLQTFLPAGYLIPASKQAGFYLEAELPRKGTDLTIRLRKIPFGLKASGSALLFPPPEIQVGRGINSSAYSEASDSEKRWDEGYAVKKAAVLMLLNPAVFSDQTYPTQTAKPVLLQWLITGKLTSIPAKDRQQLNKIIAQANADNANPFAFSLKQLSESLQFYHTVFQVDKALKRDTLLLGWDARTGKFRLKGEKRQQHPYEHFADFLAQNSEKAEDQDAPPLFWQPVC